MQHWIWTLLDQIYGLGRPFRCRISKGAPHLWVHWVGPRGPSFSWFCMSTKTGSQLFCCEPYVWLGHWFFLWANLRRPIPRRMKRCCQPRAIAAKTTRHPFWRLKPWQWRRQKRWWHGGISGLQTSWSRIMGSILDWCRYLNPCSFCLISSR